jgi:hypothetical protein
MGKFLEIKNAEYMLRVDDGCCTVYRVQKQALNITTVGADGATVAVVEEGDKPGTSEDRMLRYLNSAPVFAAIKDGKEYYVDTAAGFQRWRGNIKSTEFKKGLKRCGFTASEITKIVKAITLIEDPWLPRFG